MDRMKRLGLWLALIVGFYLFSELMMYLFLHGNTVRELLLHVIGK